MKYRMENGMTPFSFCILHVSDAQVLMYNFFWLATWSENEAKQEVTRH